MRELDRTQVTFEQAEGVTPLPTQLKLKELNTELRSYIWYAVYKSLEEYRGNTDYGGGSWVFGNFESLLEEYWVFHLHRFLDDFNSKFQYWSDFLGKIVKTGEYHQVLGFLQFCLRSRNCPNSLRRAIPVALEKGRAAYKVIDGTIVPLNSEEDRVTVETAFKALTTHGQDGAKNHLRRSAEALSSGHWADSVRESIHSVEAVVKVVAGDNGTLSSALLKLFKNDGINPNLKRAMNALYDYTSDEQGIRHAAVLKDVKVGEYEALYMFSICAAFISYSLNKNAGGQ